VGPTIYEIEVTRPRGPVRQLDQAAQDVVHRLSSEATEASYEQLRGGRRVFVLRRPHPRKVLLGPLLAEARAYLSERAGRFVVGQRPTGEVLVGDLSDSSTPHLLVGGQSGSGKSYLLRALVASLVHYHPPSAIRFILIDPKRVTFNVPSFKSAVGAHLEGPIGYDAEEALPSIERLIETMNERYELFEKERVSDVSEYNEIVSEERRLERKIVVIDEFQDLAADKASAKEFFDGIKRLGAKARAAGVHLILATQRPDRETVPPIIKTNLGGKIALRVASKVNSNIILDEPGAERLMGKGDLYANLGQGLVRAQAPLVG
jgi:S-DNA-T family DNA segregation ATPase FtsK/SpoIIIE